MLTKPEERREEEPEWVKQAKSLRMPSAQPAVQSTADIEELGRTEQERDDSFAWLESLAAKQGASEGLLTKPEERMEEEPEWIKQAKSLGAVEQPPAQPVIEEPAPAMDTGMWMQGLEAEEPAPEPGKDETGVWLKSLDEVESAPAQPLQEEPEVVSDMAAWLKSLDEEDAISAKDEMGTWLKGLEEAEEAPAQPATSDELPEWVQAVEEEEAPAAEPAVPAEEAETFEWMSAVEEPVVQEAPVSETGELPAWLSGLEEEKEAAPIPAAADELPAWLRDETVEAAAESPKIEPARAGDWRLLEEVQPEIVEPVSDERRPEPVMEQPAPEPEPVPTVQEVRPAKPPAPYKEPVTRKGTGTLKMPVDMLLTQARGELSRSNIPGALDTYSKLIKKGRFLDEVIFDLREALYRFPVEVSIWQALGDAYMRGNRLQDALDAYTKAEELLR